MIQGWSLKKGGLQEKAVWLGPVLNYLVARCLHSCQKSSFVCGRWWREMDENISISVHCMLIVWGAAREIERNVQYLFCGVWAKLRGNLLSVGNPEIMCLYSGHWGVISTGAWGRIMYCRMLSAITVHMENSSTC